MQTWIWRHFRMQHPDGWEMLHYTCDTAVGHCALADRYRFRIEFHWRRFAVQPDMQRILADYRKQLQGKRASEAVELMQHGQWRGLAKESEGVRTWRFGRFFGVENCLIELVFIWPNEPDEPLAWQMLDSVCEEPARDAQQRWRVFGMDMKVSQDLVPCECKIEPANAKLVFTTAKVSAARETFQRLGMVEQWLAGSVADWLNTQRPEAAKQWQADSARVGTHDVCYASATLSPQGFGRLWRRKTCSQTAAWICPTDQRLYSVTCDSRVPSTHHPKRLAGGRLACCEALQ
jgi:hypothetical protein